MLFLRCANIAPADPLANQSQTLLGIITDPISQDKLSGLSIPLSEEAVALLESTCLESNLNIRHILEHKPLSKFQDILNNFNILRTLKESNELNAVTQQFQLAETCEWQPFLGHPKQKEFPGLLKSAYKSLADKKIKQLYSDSTSIESAQCPKTIQSRY